MRYLTVVLFFLCGYSLNSFAQTHNPNFVDLPNSDVFAVEVDENYVYIGGNFTQCGAVFRNYIARYNRFTGALDMTWNPNAFGIVWDIKLANGSVYVCGFFNFIGGQARSFIAKLSATGTGNADPTWDPNANAVVSTIVVQGNDVYAGGDFTFIGGQPRNRIAKLSATGTGNADPTWDPNAAGGAVRTIEVHGNDVFVGGFFTSIGGQMRNYIAKLSATGTGAADPVWNPNPEASVQTVKVQGNDVFVGGAFSTIGGQMRTNIAKLSITGTGAADPVWNPNPTGVIINSISVTDEGVFVGGFFTNIGGQARSNVAKLSATGTGAADPNWSVPFNGNITDPDAIDYSYGVVFIGGFFTSPSSRFFVTGTYSVPTLSEWGMIFFAVSIVGVGVYFSKRQIKTVRV